MKPECGDEAAILDQGGSEVEQWNGRNFGEERARIWVSQVSTMEEAGWGF